MELIEQLIKLGVSSNDLINKFLFNNRFAGTQTLSEKHRILYNSVHGLKCIETLLYK